MTSDTARPRNADEIKVFISHRDSTCEECMESLGSHAWIHLVEGRGALCLSCADLDHLEYLPSRDAALTRRARKASTLSAVVLKWSRARKRYERQGLLVEEAALAQAETECLSDADQRRARAERRADRASEEDASYIAEFALAVRERHPSCPRGREHVVARHACQKYTGRVGRSRAAKELLPAAIDLAVRAHVRHAETDYDTLLAMGHERHDARRLTAPATDEVIARWREPRLPSPHGKQGPSANATQRETRPGSADD